MSARQIAAELTLCGVPLVAAPGLRGNLRGSLTSTSLNSTSDLRIVYI
jgi:hypothetical protein